jgi:hypothetical protein
MTSILKGVLKGDVFFGDLAIKLRPSADGSERLRRWRRGGNRYLV